MAWSEFASNLGKSREEIYEEYKSRRTIKFEILGAKYDLATETFTVNERMSGCYSMIVSFNSASEIKPEDVLHKECLLTIGGYISNRCFHGIITRFTLNGKENKRYSYMLMAGPLFSMLDIERDCRIYQDVTTLELIRKTFRETYITEREYEFKGIKEDEYNVRRYCVQYRESAFNHVSRRMEEDGIWYCFKHSAEGHKLIFGDKNIVCSYIQGDPKLPYNEGGMATREEAVHAIIMDQEVVPGKAIQQSHNFKKEKVSLKSEKKITHNNKNDNSYEEEFEIFDYSCDFGDEKTGKRLANVRLEEHRSRKNIFSGLSNCARFVPGFTFKLTGHSKALDQSYLLLSVEHSGEQSGRGGDYDYRNSFTAIPEKVTYRPVRQTVKPYIRGMQSAKVVGPKDGEIYTDTFGRVKVQFHWDRLGKKDENSSCWLRIIQPWAGRGRGALFLPRVGDEVIVSFLDGNPDFPIIIGSANNSTNMPFFDAERDNSISSIKTRSLGNSKGFNELRFDDKAGGEEVFIHAQKDCNITVKSRMGQTIGGDSGTLIGGNKDESISGNSYCEVKGTQTGIAKEITLSANDKITLVVGGSSVVITASDIKINGTKVYANNSSSEPAPPTKDVKGSLGRTSSASSSASASGAGKSTSQGKPQASAKQVNKASSTKGNSAPYGSATQDVSRPPELGGTSGGSAVDFAGNISAPKHDGWRLGSSGNNAAGIRDLTSNAVSLASNLKDDAKSAAVNAAKGAIGKIA